MSIICGWCGQPANGINEQSDCRNCGHERPDLPWVQRDQQPPTVSHEAGRPELDPKDIARRLREAREALPNATNKALAAHLDISIRTLGRWQKLAG